MANPLPYALSNHLLAFSMSKAQFDRVNSTCPESITPCLNAASDFANGYLSSQYNLPLLKFGSDLTMNVCHIAAFYLMVKVGFNPNSPEDQLIKARNDMAIKWLMDINNDLIHPPYQDTPTNSQNDFVITSASRGYNDLADNDNDILNVIGLPWNDVP